MREPIFQFVESISRIAKTACVLLALVISCSQTALSEKSEASRARTSTPAQQSAASNPQDAATLEFNQPIEREIKGGEKQSYKISVGEKQFARIVVEQRGMDVVVTVLGTDKEAFAQRDSVITTDGQEEIGFVALTAGVYTIGIKAKPKSAATGRYMIWLAELRDSNERERNLEEARKLHNDAAQLWEDGKFDEALAKAERALSIREKESGADDIDVAASLANLALIVSDKGDYEKAIALYKRALAIREKVFGVYHPDVARTAHNLGLSYLRSGNYEEAAKFFERAIEIREKVLGSDSPDLATSLNNLGVVYENLADYAKAEELLRRALEIKEKTLPASSPSIAASISSLASVLSAKGDEDKASELYKRALEIREKSLPANHPDIGRSLDKLATSYVTKGDYKQAEETYLRALSIFQKAFGAEHYRTAVTLGEMAVMYHLQGDDAKAEPLFRQCVAVLEKALGKNHPDYAAALYNLAEFLTDKGGYVEAGPFYQQALAIAEKIFAPQHPDVITYLEGLARNHQAMGDSAQALKFLTRAHKLSERNAQAILFTNSERQKFLYLDSLSGETNQFISAHLKFAPNDSAAAELALTTLLERKGRALDATAIEFAALHNRFNKDDRALFDKLREVTSQLSQKILTAPQNANAAEREKQIKDLEEEKENLEREISVRSAEFRSKIQPVALSSIEAAIPENGALVEFGIYRPFDPKAGKGKAFGEPRYAAYVVRRRGEVRWTELGDARMIDAAIETYRQALRDPERKDFEQTGRALDEKIMQPVRALAGDATHLIVSPDGELNLVPFEALIDERGRFLIERYAVTYLTSGRDLLRLQTARASKSAPEIFADPVFGEPALPQMARVSTKEKTSALTRRRRSVTNADDLSSVYFAPLNSTSFEAQNIGALFPDAAMFTGKDATETALKRADAPRILHIATHGFFLSDASSPTSAPALIAANMKDRRAISAKVKVENPLLRSGLALAGANLRASNGEGDDGILTALEASGLNLWGTKLVVLSACDTGVGEIKNGEGVYGLRRAFVLAGSETQVMSLWAVSDYVTRQLMVGFYKNLKQGMNRGEALRQAKLDMLKRRYRRHPFYWAGFIESGEWANLDGKR